jgi:hypothetical protein
MGFGEQVVDYCQTVIVIATGMGRKQHPYRCLANLHHLQWSFLLAQAKLTVGRTAGAIAPHAIEFGGEQLMSADSEN